MVPFNYTDVSFHRSVNDSIERLKDKENAEYKTTKCVIQKPYKRSNSSIFELDLNQKLTKTIGYRYKLLDLNRSDFTTIYAGKLCSILKFCLTGLEEISKETILRMKPDANSSTIKPLHQFIQCYNGNQFLLMLFALTKLDDKTYCHFNGTDKRTET